MKPTGYRVIFQGIQPGKDIQGVKQALADAFHATPEKIEVLLSKLPVVLKENVDHTKALEYQRIVLKAGGDCRVEPLGETDANPSIPSGSASPLKICPKCGYEAVSSDDPLLTAYEGRGECPACGIILAKFNRDEARPPGGTALKQDIERSSIISKSTRHAFPTKMLFLGLVIIAAVVYYAMTRNDASRQAVNGNEAPAGRQAATQVQRPGNQSTGPAAEQSRITAADLLAEQERARWVGPSFRIAPGETKTFTISIYLPYLHEDKVLALNMQPLYYLDTNTWKEMGVQAEVTRATVTNHSVTLWELYQKEENTWRPVRAERSMKIASGGQVRSAKGPDFLHCSNTSTLRKLAEISREEVDEAVKKYESGSPELRQNRFVLYRADLEMSIRLPAGVEFGARELKRTSKGGEEVSQTARTGKLHLKVMGVTVEDGLGYSLSLWASFDMAQESGKEGILVALSSSTPDWEIHE